uniref:Secreted protein n=1 Tax=Elaeophora elaphi TaxID=1147741 RepID=A0A158Q8H5_9BILA
MLRPYQVGVLYLSVVIIIVILDGAIPRLCGGTAVTTSMRGVDILHSAYEEPRPVVHNIPPEYDTLRRPPPILPLHNNG